MNLRSLSRPSVVVGVVLCVVVGCGDGPAIDQAQSELCQSDEAAAKQCCKHAYPSERRRERCLVDAAHGRGLCARGHGRKDGGGGPDAADAGNRDGAVGLLDASRDTRADGARDGAVGLLDASRDTRADVAGDEAVGLLDAGRDTRIDAAGDGLDGVAGRLDASGDGDAGTSACVPSQGACGGATPCCSGETCTGGVCGGTCATFHESCDSASCCTGFRCTNGECVPTCGLPGVTCDSADPCCGGSLCVNGICLDQLCRPVGSPCGPGVSCCSGLTCQQRVCAVPQCASLGSSCDSTIGSCCAPFQCGPAGRCQSPGCGQFGCCQPTGTPCFMGPCCSGRCAADGVLCL